MKTWSKETRITALVVGGVVILGSLAILVFGGVDERIVENFVAALVGSITAAAAILLTNKRSKG